MPVSRETSIIEPIVQRVTFDCSLYGPHQVERIHLWMAVEAVRYSFVRYISTAPTTRFVDPSVIVKQIAYNI